MLPQNHFRQTTIGNSVYHIKLLDGRTGFRVAKSITSLVLPLLGESFDSGKHDDIYHGAPKTFRNMALLLLEQTDKIDIEDLIFNQMFAYLVVDGAPVKLEDLVIGNYGVLVELVTFALKENFGSLFEGKHLVSRFRNLFSNQDNNPI